MIEEVIKIITNFGLPTALLILYFIKLVPVLEKIDSTLDKTNGIMLYACQILKNELLPIDKQKLREKIDALNEELLK